MTNEMQRRAVSWNWNTGLLQWARIPIRSAGPCPPERAMSRILVIDQDEPSRALLREWLCAEGHEVVDLAPAQARGAVAVDLVLVDLPRLRQRMAERVREVRALYPQAAIIGLSTQVPCSLPDDSALPGALGLHQLLGKPGSRDELLHAVGAALRRLA